MTLRDTRWLAVHHESPNAEAPESYRSKHALGRLRQRRFHDRCVSHCRIARRLTARCDAPTKHQPFTFSKGEASHVCCDWNRRQLHHPALACPR